MEKVKTDMAHLVSLLNQYAGQSNKSNIVQVNAERYADPVERVVPEGRRHTIMASRRISGSGGSGYGAPSQNGKGSWTTMKAIAGPLRLGGAQKQRARARQPGRP